MEPLEPEEEKESEESMNTERCIYIADSFHGNLLIQGYYNSSKIGIYKETSSILDSNNLQKYGEIQHRHLLGSFVKASPSDTKFLILKAIYTKES